MLRRIRFGLLLTAALVWWSTAPTAQAGRITVAAAADLQTALPEIANGFERRTGVKVALTFGSSGSFFAQIQNGAPFDLFFSADADYPRRLAASKSVDAQSVYDYASGGLVLWTRADSGIDVGNGLAVLRDTRVRRIAIANPAVAPYGRAAVAALKSARVYDAVQPKLVNAENVTQAAQLAESGNADVALIGHALALGGSLKPVGRFDVVPPSLHPPIVQAAAIVSASKNKEQARAFLDYMKGADARRILQAFGFDVPAVAAAPR